MLASLAHLGVVRRNDEVRHADELIARYGIRVGSREQAVTSLSGGNQQKVAISRVLCTEPSVVIIEEPTQGVDVRSRMDIYRFLRAATDEGLAVVLYSSDASELAGLADRIVVLSRGRIVDEFSGATATEESIVGAFVGATRVGAGHDRRSTDPVRARAPAVRPATGRRAVNDLKRMSVLVVGLLLIGAYARLRNDTFLTTLSLQNIALLSLPLALAADRPVLRAARRRPRHRRRRHDRTDGRHPVVHHHERAAWRR